jgi:hypothetical protein
MYKVQSKCLVFCVFLALCTSDGYAQKITDKAEADWQVCRDLLSVSELPQWYPNSNIKKNMLKETNEKNIYCVEGKSFQVKSLRSDYYVSKVGEEYRPLFDRRYPVESFANLLLARVSGGKRLVELRHHQYGNHIASMTIPLNRLHNLFGPDMEIYCRVTVEGNTGLSAWLVFYQSKEKYIHLLELNAPVKSVFLSEGTFSGDFYSNIPQGNIKNLFQNDN